MTDQIFGYISHKNGAVEDSAYEIITAAKKINAGASVTAIVVGGDEAVNKVCSAIGSTYSNIWKISGKNFEYPNAELIRALLVKILPAKSLLILGHDTFGMDLSPGLSIKLNSSFAADIVNIEGLEGNNLKLVRQEFSGQVSTHVLCDISNGAVINIRGGAFHADEAKSGSGKIEDKSKEAEGLKAKRRFIEVVQAEVGDVDITKSDILVSIGRGIGEQENIAIAEELAKTIGADLSCSRPIVDAKWLEKSRQVGTSGQTVKPKVYIALGISGSFQHLGGIKGSPFMVAVNKNSKAPIFQVADVGIVEDLLEFVPVLTEKVNAMK